MAGNSHNGQSLQEMRTTLNNFSSDTYQILRSNLLDSDLKAKVYAMGFFDRLVLNTGLLLIVLIILIMIPFVIHPMATMIVILPIGYTILGIMIANSLDANTDLRFALLTGDSGDKKFPINLLNSNYREHRKESPFFSTYRSVLLPGVETGDVVIFIDLLNEKKKKNETQGYIILRKEGVMPLYRWVSDNGRYEYQGDIPPASEEVKQQALRFIEMVDLYRVYQAKKSEAAEKKRKDTGFNVHTVGDQRDEEAAAKRAEAAEALWTQIYLPDALKANLRDLGEKFMRKEAGAAQGILLYGPPGTGKSLLARTLADALDGGFIAVNLHDVKGRYIGESGQLVKALWQRAKAYRRCIIFIDECESVFIKRGSRGSDSFTDDIVQAFIAEWDGFSKQDSVLVMGATNRRDLIDEAVLSRFAEQVEIPLPDASARFAILQNELTKGGWQGELPAHAADFLQGFSGRDIANLAKQLLRSGAPIDEAALADATRNKRTGANSSVDSQATWDRLILNAETKKMLLSMCTTFTHAEQLRAKGMSVPRGALLYGPPGTGKTQIARTMANESGLSFIGVTTADLKGQFIGESGQKVKDVFERARSQAPCILFVDELDIVAPARGQESDKFTNEIVGQLLQELDGIKAQEGDVFVLAASNLPDSVDAAVLSRFNRRIEIALPDAQARAAILQVLLGKKPIAFDLQEGSQALATRSEGMSGRDLRNWVDAAEQNAIIRHLDDMENVQIDLADFE